MAVYFYKINEEYGCFSNFAHYGFTVNGKWWSTSEHYFQAEKFNGTSYEEKIRLLESPMMAADLGRDRTLPLRKDWEDVKDDIMRKAVFEKFSQNSEIQRILIQTGVQEIIERTTSDYYWGCGTNGDGKNVLGQILMEIREKLNKRTDD